MSGNLNGHNGLFSYDSFGKSKKSENFNFLWWCSGAQQDILRNHPSEQVKYSGLGGVLLATFALAALSAGYALYSVFHQPLIAVAFAIVWGLIIFNFDRFLVSTMRKYGVSTRRQILMALPRFVLALLIGITIARPLELKIFEKEINIKTTQNLHRKMLLNDSLLALETRQQVQTATLERDRLTNRKRAIEDALGLLQQSYVTEADGTGGSGQRGIEKLTRLKMSAYEQAFRQTQPELASLALAISVQDSIIQAANTGMEIRRKEFESSLANNIGFLERNKALSDLADEESSVYWSCFLISLLIILIETAPVLSKLMMHTGPYDIALGKQELLQMAASENEIRREKALVYERNRKSYEKQQEISEELLNQLSELQRKHIKEELELWEKGEETKGKPKPSLDELLKRIRDRYQYSDQDLL